MYFPMFVWLKICYFLLRSGLESRRGRPINLFVFVFFFELDIVKVMNCFCFLFLFIYLFIYYFFAFKVVHFSKKISNHVLGCLAVQCSNNMLAFISCYLQIQSTFTSSVDLFLK